MIDRPALPLKTHGGKCYLASRIVALMPPHKHYVEPFAGGLAVLLARNPNGVSEVVNDRNRDLTNFWRVLQDPDQFERFARVMEAVPFSETEWNDAAHRLADPDSVVRAIAFFVRCRQSLAGRMRSFAPISRSRTRRGMGEQSSAWQSAVKGLPAVHARLWPRVVILNHDALDVIRERDGPDTLFYCDPPYYPDTRTAPQVYVHEMSADDHAELLTVVKRCRGMVMVSGYANDLYDRELRDWTRHDFDLPNNAASGKSKRRMTECVWCNFQSIHRKPKEETLGVFD